MFGPPLRVNWKAQSAILQCNYIQLKGTGRNLIMRLYPTKSIESNLIMRLYPIESTEHNLILQLYPIESTERNLIIQLYPIERHRTQSDYAIVSN